MSANNALLASVHSAVAVKSNGQYVAALLSSVPAVTLPTADTPVHARSLLSGSKNFVYMTPGIVTGLMIGFFLFATALVGICCLMSIQTPTRFCSEALPVGKEF